MRLLVCGDRNWWDKSLIEQYIILYMPNVIIEGDARGADKMAGEIAKELGLSLEVYPADWNTFKKAAGPIRNNQMLKEGKPDTVLAFHDDIRNSKGTKHMVSIATKAGIPTAIVSHAGLEEWN